MTKHMIAVKRTFSSSEKSSSSSSSASSFPEASYPFTCSFATSSMKWLRLTTKKTCVPIAGTWLQKLEPSLTLKHVWLSKRTVEGVSPS